jgi:hypothetical protein
MLEWCLIALGQFDPYDSVELLAHARIRRDGALVAGIRPNFLLSQKTSVASG